jgi:hypothetical protein
MPDQLGPDSLLSLSEADRYTDRPIPSLSKLEGYALFKISGHCKTRR